jgi:hypothetical protein
LAVDLAAAHTDGMSACGHDLPAYVVAEAHSHRQDIADLITIANAAEELGCTQRHVRRMTHAGTSDRIKQPECWFALKEVFLHHRAGADRQISGRLASP